MPLYIVLACTAVISVFLIYGVVVKHSEVSETSTKIEEFKKILNNANKKKPAPVTENFRNMNSDAERLDMKTKQIQRLFGKYYRKALIRFANTLGFSGKDLEKHFAEYYKALSDELKAEIAGTADKAKIDAFLKQPEDPKRLEAAIREYGDLLNETNLLNDFAQYYNKLPKEKKGMVDGQSADGLRNPDKDLLEEFFKQKKYKPETLKLAIDNFIKDIKSITVESVDSNNVHEFILASLGLPRTAFVTSYKAQLKRLQRRMFEQKLFPDAESVKDVENLTFGADFQPRQNQIPHVIRQMMLREDIFRRAKQSNLSSFVSISELTPALEGKKENDRYLSFSYEIVVTGTMNQLRDFINRLQTAYKDNVVYRIRDIEISRNNPEDIADLTSKDTKDPGILLAEKFQMGDFTPQDTEENLLAASYGKPVLGRSKQVRMRLNADTLLFIADQLERIDLSRK